MRTLADQLALLRDRVAVAGGVDATYVRSAADAPDGRVIVLDAVLPDVAAYRAAALAQPFESHTFGDATFHGIGTRVDTQLPDLIAARYPHVTPTLSFFRKSPRHQVEPNYIHTDRDMGEWTAILYLTQHPPAADGTTFWQHRATGARASTATTPEALQAEWRAWRDRSQWEPWTTVAAKENRLVLFPAACFHSRAIHENYGGGDRARLIQIVFGTGGLPCV